MVNPADVWRMNIEASPTCNKDEGSMVWRAKITYACMDKATTVSASYTTARLKLADLLDLADNLTCHHMTSAALGCAAHEQAHLSNANLQNCRLSVDAWFYLHQRSCSHPGV